MNARDRLNHLMVPNNIIRRLNAEKLERIDRRDAELELAQLSDVATDFGRITAGEIDVADGSVLQNDEGVSLSPDTGAVDSIKMVKWVDGDGQRLGSIFTSVNDSAPNRYGVLTLMGDDENHANSRGEIQCLANGVTRFRININGVSNNANEQGGKAHFGDYVASFSQSVTTTPADLISDTVEANSLGSNGQVRYHLEFKDNNTSGANRTHTITYNFGSLAFTTTFSVVNVAANPSDTIFVDICSWNDAATNSQVHTMRLGESANNGSGTLGAITHTAGWATSAIDSTADIAVSITIASSANNAGQTVKGVADRHGPYYA